MRRAFTFIELIVLSGIAVVLFALIAPAASAMVRATPRSMCSARLRLICQSMAAYALEHERKFPTAGAADSVVEAIGFARGTGAPAPARRWLTISPPLCGS